MSELKFCLEVEKKQKYMYSYNNNKKKNIYVVGTKVNIMTNTYVLKCRKGQKRSQNCYNLFV